MKEQETSAAAQPAVRYSAPEEVEVLRGPVGTGKTEALVGRLAKALAAGVDPTDVLVVACSRTAADELARRVSAATGPLAAGVRVATPVELALEALAAPEAFLATGRRAHVLTDVENTFFLEDMRVTGIKNRRLRELLKFLQRGWSEMREDEDGWIITVEERNVENLAKSRLAMLQALHPAEATAVAVRFLARHPEARGGLACAHVFADDYRSMGRASQILVAGLAERSLTVVWDDNAALPGEEPYAYAGGLTELLEAASQVMRTGLATSVREGGLGRVTNNLLSQECLDAPVRLDEGGLPAEPGDALTELTAGELSQEPERVAAAVAAEVARGVKAEDVFVACPSDAWVRRMAHGLAAAGVPESALEGRQAVGGDVRQLDRSAAAQVACALSLLACPESPLAWRCWCGFGDYLASSAGMNELYERAQEQGGGLLAQLKRVHGAGDVVGGERIAQRLQAARELMASARGLAGEELLACVARAVTGSAELPAPIGELLGEVGAAEGATELDARLARALRGPAFAPGCVRVGRYEALAGQTPRVLVCAGMANGLLPAHAYFDLSEASMDDQAKLHRRLIDMLVEATGKARERLICSGFANAGVEDAERLHLWAQRVRLEGCRRVCSLAPSVCLSFMRGEQLAKPVF